MDFVNGWSEKAKLPLCRFIAWLGIAKSKFYNWHARYGKVNEHNGKIPRDFWLEDWEKRSIIDFYSEHLDEGYRRLTFMMLDANVVAVSPTSVWRVLHDAGLLNPWNGKASKKGTGFIQPLQPHEHWHPDVSYINICGTFYYLCSVLDGCSRFIVHWDIRESMTEADIEIILEHAKEAFPLARPRIISDNGPQFIAKDLRVHPHQRHDPRTDLPVLPPEQRQDRARTNPSRPNASGPAPRCRSTTPGGSSPATSGTTTKSGCTAPSDS
jgi:hypothetical protein